jgi:hypothetical protein
MISAPKSSPALFAATLLLSFGLAAVTPPARAAAAPVRLHWLDEPAPAAQSVSWGVPWPEGAVPPGEAFHLTDAAGRAVPLQTWPLAYWPDGSLKWTGCAAVVPAGPGGELTLAPGPSTAPAGEVRVTQDGKTVVVDTGALTCVIPLSGHHLVDSLRIGGWEVARAGQLVGILQEGPATSPEDAPPRVDFVSLVKQVTVEQAGPVRAVVRIQGVHQLAATGREWLPFTVRLYFYTSDPAVRIVHTFIFDGDQEKDFIRGLGLQFAVPLRDGPQNRYVRFVGADGGLWSEPLQPGGGNAAQEAGEPFTGRGEFAENAVWNDFKLSQPGPDGFTIVKRTNPKSTWLASDAGTRAAGFAFVGDLTGGLGMSVKNFWQSCPAELEVRHAAQPEAELIAWLWAPDGPEMDLRHYDVVAHGLNASYEDVQPGFSTACGVARTSELTLFPTAALPARAAAVALAESGTQRALLASTPAYLHSTGVFGVWSLVDRSTPFKQAIEDGLDSVLSYYEHQVDERNWYGFWQYGDFMHSYSAPRHKWHYDWGGHAWDNTELGAPLWLWYSFLRSGRADLFRLAEAHTRNTSETNVYHLGPMAGLGSRHNVAKWGDGAKEVRISQAAHWRIFYYLTTDERTGDIMRQVAREADVAITKYDPMREAAPLVPGEPDVGPHIRIGPDWFALAGNWMTEWERTGDTRWRDRILAGVDSIVAMPYWLETGELHGLNPDLPGGGLGPLKGGGAQVVGFDLKTGNLTPVRDPVTKGSVPVSYNLATIQGGGEVMFELVPLLGRKDFVTAWLQYCRIGQAPAEILTKDRTTGTEGADGRYILRGQSGPRLAAYAYAHTGDRAFADKAIEGMLNEGGGIAHPQTLRGPDTLNVVKEDPAVSTNEAAQTGLSTIEILELCQDALPHDAPAHIGRPPRPPAGRGSTP